MARDHHFSLAATAARFEAWWKGGRLDRPPVTVHVRPGTPARRPWSEHPTLRDYWLDAEFRVATAKAELEAGIFVGDTLPAWTPDVGPDLVATLFGAEIDFRESNGWARPTVFSTGAWEQFLATPPAFDSVYWQTTWMMMERAATAFAGRFYIGLPDLHGNYDILAALRTSEDLCLDFLDSPELVRRAGRHAARAHLETYRRFFQRLTQLGQPCTTWIPFFHWGPAGVVGCDVLALVGSEIAESLILPDVEFEAQPLERILFHLDGHQALRHLDAVLRLPGLNAVQWDFGPGLGPAGRWLDVYRRIREAGKSVQVLAVNAADALDVLRALGPTGVWLTVAEYFPNVNRAEEFLDAVHALSR